MDEFLDADFLARVIDHYSNVYRLHMNTPDPMIPEMAREIEAAKAADLSTQDIFGAPIAEFLTMGLAGV